MSATTKYEYITADEWNGPVSKRAGLTREVTQAALRGVFMGVMPLSEDSTFFFQSRTGSNGEITLKKGRKVILVDTPKRGLKVLKASVLLPDGEPHALTEGTFVRIAVEAASAG